MKGLAQRFARFSWHDYKIRVAGAIRLSITGCCGVIGSNLAAGASAEGDRVTLFKKLSRVGSNESHQMFREQRDVDFRYSDRLKAFISGISLAALVIY